MKLRHLKYAALAIGVGAAPGCALDSTSSSPAEQVNVGQTAQALSIAGGATVFGTDNSGPDAQLGPANQQTCFLTGVAGDFIGDPFVTTAPNGLPFGPIKATAAVFIKDDGFWYLRAHAGTGTGVQARAVCVFATAHRTHFSWQDNLAIQGVDATPDRQCFLSSVWSTSGLSGDSGFVPNTGTAIKLKKRNGQWDMNDSNVQNIGGDSEFAGATAMCVDMPGASASSTLTFTGPAFGSTTSTIHDTDGSTFPVASAGCFLNGVSGRWINMPFDTLGANDGVFFTNDPAISPHWRVTASNAKTATARCVQ